jgi:hypothetical protein
MTAMTLIESKTLGTAAASIEFTSIPQDGTDLVFLISARSDATTASGGGSGVLRPNGSSSNLSSRRLQGTGSATSSTTSTTVIYRIDPSDYTASTFGNSSIYFPNYAGSTAKSFSVDAVNENNATEAVQQIVAGLWDNTAAITSMTFLPNSGNFVSGTTISLYKITKGSDGIVTTS